MRRRGPRLKPLIDTINPSTIEAALRPHYKKWVRGDHLPGRPPLNPVGMVLALIIMLVRSWSRADLVAFLHRHPEWLRFLGLDHVPDDSTWSKLLDRVPTETLNAILSSIVNDLRRRRFLRFTVAAADSSFVAACHWDTDARWGYARRDDRRSLPEGRFVEKGGKTLGFGYRVHVVVDADAELAACAIVTPGNVVDSVAWPEVLREGRECVPWELVAFFAADSGYDTVAVRASLATFRGLRVLIEPQRLPPGVEWGGFRGRDAAMYAKRSGVERFFSMLKRFLSLHRWGVVGLERVRKHVALAVIACLVVAWSNHRGGRAVHSVEQFRRAVA